MKRSKTLYLVAIFAWLVAAAGGCLPVHAQSFAYVANAGDATVSAYKIDSTTGALSLVGTFRAVSGVSSVAVDPSGKFAYVTNFSSNNVSAYTIDSTTGALSQLGNSPFQAGSGPTSVAVDPSGKFAYVANNNDSTVSAYSINSTTGTLSQLSSSPFRAGSSPRSVAVDPSGKFAYVANTGGGVSAYIIDSTTGALTQLSTSPFTTGAFPFSVAVDPSGKFAYVVNNCVSLTDCSSGTVSAYTIDSTTGALTPLSNSPFAAGGGWSFLGGGGPLGQVRLCGEFAWHRLGVHHR